MGNRLTRVILVLVSTAGLISSPSADDAVTILHNELADLDLTSPENDLAQGNVVCFSIDGYARNFPGVPEQDRPFCKARERNFRGTSDVIATMSKARL